MKLNNKSLFLKFVSLVLLVPVLSVAQDDPQIESSDMRFNIVKEGVDTQSPTFDEIELLTDGVIPVEGTSLTDSSIFHWNFQAIFEEDLNNDGFPDTPEGLLPTVVVMIVFERDMLVSDIQLSMSNRLKDAGTSNSNNMLIEYSADFPFNSYSRLEQAVAWDPGGLGDPFQELLVMGGEVDPNNPLGMSTRNTIAGSPNFNGSDFSTVRARALRIKFSNYPALLPLDSSPEQREAAIQNAMDTFWGLGEIQVFGKPAVSQPIPVLDTNVSLSWSGNPDIIEGSPLVMHYDGSGYPSENNNSSGETGERYEENNESDLQNAYELAGFRFDGVATWGLGGVVVQHELEQMHLVSDIEFCISTGTIPDVFRVEYSTDGQCWNDLIVYLPLLHSNSLNMDYVTTYEGSKNYVADLDFQPVHAKYIRFFFTGGSQFAISKMMLVGFPQLDYEISDDVMTINGTCDDDTIVISSVGGSETDFSLEINSATEAVFSTTNIQRVIVNGHEGNDTITIDDVFKAEVNCGDGDDTVTIDNAFQGFVYGGDGNDLIAFNGISRSFLYGEDGDDIINGGRGQDYIEGGLGYDEIFGGNGNDTILCGDSSVSDLGPNLAFGGPGADDIIGAFGNDTLSGGDGFDYLYGGLGQGEDTILGGLGQDLLEGGFGDDYMHGGEGHDTMHGGFGDDEMFGGGGRDTINGNDGADLINGGVGNDTIDAGNDNDTVVGGDGADEIQGGGGDDILNGNRFGDVIYGGGGDDTINGGDGADQIFGQAGNDLLRGNNHGDVIDGGLGDDTLTGGQGNDELHGGAGIDTATDTGEAGESGIEN